MISSKVSSFTHTEPGAPRNFRVLQRQQTSISLSWQPPAPEQQNGIITSYTVYITPDGGSTYTIVTAGLNLVVSSLLPNTRYHFTVAASNEAGLGPQTSPSLEARTIPPGK